VVLAVGGVFVLEVFLSSLCSEAVSGRIGLVIEECSSGSIQVAVSMLRGV
jgi:hypothetical protein